MIDVKGFSFIEFTSKDLHIFHDLFINLGFTRIDDPCCVYQRFYIYEQGNIRFITSSLGGFEQYFAKLHGPSVSSFGFTVDKSREAYKEALSLGAEDAMPDIYHCAIRGVGDSKLYLTDKIENNPDNIGVGLQYIDHLTHNVNVGQMDKWADFYSQIFGFKQIRFFDIKGKKTGLVSKAMGNGKIAIPINEPTEEKSQIQEYLDEYNGEGVQHIALHTDDIYKTVKQLRANGIEFLDVPDTYYDMLEERIPGHDEDLDQLKENKILVDGQKDNLLLQLFTKTYVGPIFFEIIQRKGNNGFGEGNFQALFESMERDQMERGVL